MKEMDASAAIVALTLQITVFMMTVLRVRAFASAAANKGMALSQGLLSAPVTHLALPPGSGCSGAVELMLHRGGGWGLALCFSTTQLQFPLLVLQKANCSSF